MKKVVMILCAVILLYSNHVVAQQVKAANVAFYNLENLFDIEDDPEINDQDFLPTGGYSWGDMKYQNKLKNMSKVISQIGDTEDGSVKWNGPTFLGVAEVENRKVLEDLIATPMLKSCNYGIVHKNSPDHRGIDVAFFYKKDVFKVVATKTFKYVDKVDPDKASRDQLLVSGDFDGDRLHFIVIHWPSRGAPSPKRVIAAKISRGIIDSLLAEDKNAKIFVMGDFNDTPVDESLNYLTHKSTGKKPEGKVVKMFNPMKAIHKSGTGTIAYQDVWSVFDMIVISPGVMRGDGYTYKTAKIFDRTWLHQQEGRYAGYPLRTHAGGKYLNGYSDHLPVYMYLIKEIE